MPDSLPLNQRSAPTIAKLLEVDAALATQEADLTAQVQSIQEKRRSLKSVIDMFGPAVTAQPVGSPAPTLASETNGNTQQAVTQDGATPEVDSPQVAPAADAKMLTTPNEPKQKAHKQKAPASRKQAAKPALAAKTSGKAQGWQQYLRDDFSNVALSDAVAIVLQEQSEQVVEIASVVNAIFEEEMPQLVRGTARTRVSDVLSKGAKNNKWHRTGEGKYSMSGAAADG